MMPFSAVALLTRRLGRVTLNSYPSITAATPLVRTFASGGRGVDKKKKHLEQRARKHATNGETTQQVNLQHQEWVKFQQSIAIQGFETGQTTTLTGGLGPKRRGGKAARKRRDKEELEKVMQEKQRKLDIVGGGQYPPLRYSPEETDRLLKEAYDNLPKRTGKRGTRNLKRQANRWHAVRKARKIAKKNYGIRKHERRMAERSRISREVRETKAEAPWIRERDAAYQQHVLERWTEIMFGTTLEDNSADEERKAKQSRL